MQSIIKFWENKGWSKSIDLYGCFEIVRRKGIVNRFKDN